MPEIYTVDNKEMPSSDFTVHMTVNIPTLDPFTSNEIGTMVKLISEKYNVITTQSKIPSGYIWI